MEGGRGIMIYVTSDWHLNHNQPFIYQSRGYNTVEEMNQAILERYNEIVTPDDTVYVLGDCLLGPIEGVQLLSQFNGHKILVAGNHCTDNRLAAYDQAHIFEHMCMAMRLKYNGYSFYLSHYPTLTANYDDKGLKQMTINLCGHIHTTDPFYHMKMGIMSYHVEVDAHDLRPISLDDIINDIKENKKQYGQL
jgi:calcineurin-like phosphoesterase family protein